MTFDEWWDENYGNLGSGQPGVFSLAFREVAEKAWNSSRQALVDELLEKNRMVVSYSGANTVD